ncbi:MAG: glycosyltransferase [Prevotella sp.]|nr:glycosyltransferase [Prevotella sp.]
MKVLIVNTSERKGGASVAANRLTEALINNGVKAKMMVMEKQTDELYVVDDHRWLLDEWNFLWERVVIWANNLFSRHNLFKVSIANTGRDITTTREFQEADIIHLHWVNQGYLSLRSIRKVLKSGKPVVWTMHDMWPMTAICHYAYQCNRYETGCSHCHFLRRPGANDLSARVFRKKQAVWRDAKVTFVCVSNWLADMARKSLLTGDKPIMVIPNVLSLSHFSLIDRTDARSTLHLQARYVVAFGAACIDADIKGLTYLLQALHKVTEQGYARPEELRLLLFGGIKDEQVLKQVPVPYTYYGYVNDPHQMSLIYSASNAVVSASLYETFGQTIIEAQACGCTPVAFGNSGQADIITHKVNGYLADYLSVDSLAEGIHWAMTADVKRRTLRSNVLTRYSESVIALKYANLYNTLLK